MQAFAKVSSTGPIELTEVPKPEPGANELLVKISAIGVGIHDEYFYASNVAYPYVIGMEAAGVIEKVGSNVDGYEPGERVAFVSLMQPKGGTWAEYAVIDGGSLILPVPDEMTLEQAAAVLIPGSTALKALVGANLQAGESLFIAGGAGAIGTLLIQIAKSRGYKVIASASKKNHQFMLDLGANHVVDYHDNNWQEQVRALVPGGVDAAIAIHPGTPLESQPVVKNGGVLIAVSGDNFVTERGILLKGIFNDVDVREELIDLIQRIVSGEIRLTINKIYPFSEALAALEQVKTRRTRGKLVLAIASSL